jgi:hypothetical protein
MENQSLKAASKQLLMTGSPCGMSPRLKKR